MIQTKLNPLKPTEHRNLNKFIILSHISNFPLKTHAFPPDLRNKTYYHALPSLRTYYREFVEMKHLPFHFYVSNIMKEWEVFTTAPTDYKIPLFEKAAENYYMEDKYRNSILICIQDNFSLNIPDDRMFDVLAYSLIEPLVKEFGGNFRDNVLWFDEIFNWEKYTSDQAANSLDWAYPYEVNRMKFFDRVIFNLAMMKFI